MSTTQKTKAPKLLYFFYNDEVHKKLHINRPADIITAFNYPQGRIFKYVYSDVRKNGEKAFGTMEVCRMIGRSRMVVERLIYTGTIRRPQQSYKMDETRSPWAFWWREKDIMDLHAYFLTVHRGRPRNDGIVSPGKDIPSAAELRARIRQDTILYVQTPEGEFVPTWQAEKF